MSKSICRRSPSTMAVSRINCWRPPNHPSPQHAWAGGLAAAECIKDCLLIIGECREKSFYIFFNGEKRGFFDLSSERMQKFIPPVHILILCCQSLMNGEKVLQTANYVTCPIRGLIAAEWQMHVAAAPIIWNILFLSNQFSILAVLNRQVSIMERLSVMSSKQQRSEQS